MAEAATEDHIRELLRRSGNPYRITRDPTISPPSDDLILPPPAELTLPGVTPRAAQDDAEQEPSFAPAQRQAMEGMIADEGRRQADTRRAAAARTPEQSAADAESFVGETLRRRKVASDSAQARNDKADTMQRDRSIASDRAAQDAWWAKHQAWQAQMDSAIETGNFPLQQRLRAAEPKQPAISLDSTGGKEIAEIQSPVQHTLELVRKASPEAAAALEALDTGLDAQGNPLTPGAQPNTDVLDANFAHLDPGTDDEPGERFWAMLTAGRNLASNNQSLPDIVGLPERQRGGIGAPGRQLMPAGRTAPRSDYDIGPGKPTGTPRSPMEDPFTGGPRRLPANAGSASGGLGRSTAPAPSTTALIQNIDLDKAEFTDAEKDAVLMAAHQMGMDLSAYDDSASGQRDMLDEAFRMVREHKRKVLGAAKLNDNGETLRDEKGNIAYAGGTQRIVGTNNPDNPYAYAETPQARRNRETRDLVRRTHEYIGNHPLPSSADQDLHKKLLAAAQSGDMETYHNIRRQLRGLEIQGQKEMLVQRRKMKAMTHQMNDPEIRQGVFSQAMQDAGDDPQAQALVMRQFGFFDQANQILGLEAQQAGIADARHARDRELDIKQLSAENPKGLEAQPEDADTAITNKVDSLMLSAASGEGGGTYAATQNALAPAKLPAQEVRARYLRSAKKHRLPINHPELAPALIDEWVNGDYTHLYGGSYLDQFVRNVARKSGFSEDEVRRWAETNAETLRRHSYGKEGWSDQRPAGAQAPMPASQPVTVTGK